VLLGSTVITVAENEWSTATMIIYCLWWNEDYKRSRTNRGLCWGQKVWCERKLYMRLEKKAFSTSSYYRWASRWQRPKYKISWGRSFLHI
jgi:hypothetical protein